MHIHTVSTEESDHGCHQDSYHSLLGSPVVDKHLAEITSNVCRVRILCFGEYGIGKSCFLHSYTDSSSSPSPKKNQETCQVYLKLLREELFPARKRAPIIGVEFYELPSTFNLQYYMCYLEEAVFSRPAAEAYVSCPCVSQFNISKASQDRQDMLKRPLFSQESSPPLPLSPQSSKSIRVQNHNSANIQCASPQKICDYDNNQSAAVFDALIFFFEVNQRNLKFSLMSFIKKMFRTKKTLDSQIWDVPILLVGLKKDKLPHSEFLAEQARVTREFKNIFNSASICYYGRESATQSPKKQVDLFVNRVCNRKLMCCQEYKQYCMLGGYQSMYQLYSVRQIVQTGLAKVLSRLPLYKSKPLAPRQEQQDQENSP